MSVYFAYFHSIKKCGNNFGGNSSNSKIIFKRKIVRLKAAVKRTNSCKSLFKRFRDHNSSM
jgi:hypothetical protein